MGLSYAMHPVGCMLEEVKENKAREGSCTLDLVVRDLRLDLEVRDLRYPFRWNKPPSISILFFKGGLLSTEMKSFLSNGKAFNEVHMLNKHTNT